MLVSLYVLVLFVGRWVPTQKAVFLVTNSAVTMELNTEVAPHGFA